MNLTGIEGHSMPADLNMEEKIGYIKVKLSFIFIFHKNADLICKEYGSNEGSLLHVGSTGKSLCYHCAVAKYQEASE